MTNILLLYNEFIPSVRLCAYEQLNYLKKKGLIRFNHCKTSKITNHLACNADVVFFVRSDSYLEQTLAEKFKNSGKYLVYVLDDDLLNIPDGLSSSIQYKSKVVQRRIKKIMSLCNSLCSPSPLILKKYGLNFKKTVLIEEPATSIKKIKAKKCNDYKIKIGFAGSVDRSIDIDILMDDVVEDILEKYNDKVEFEFFGAKPEIISKYKLKYYPYEDSYEKYQKKMNELDWDIGLAPIQDTPFNNCKHYNKYIEYSAFQIIGIYSNVLPYTNIIENNRNGLLSDNTREAWVNAISELIEDTKKRNEMKEAIKQSVKDKFLINVISENFYSGLYEIFNYKAPSNEHINIKFLKVKASIVKCIEFIKRYGMKFPYEIVKRLIKR